MIITFGPQHYAQDGTPLQNRFVRVGGPDSLAARREAFMLFGRAWGFLYADEQAAGVQTYGLTEYVILTRSGDGRRAWLMHSFDAHVHFDGPDDKPPNCDACLHLDERRVRRPALKTRLV